MEKEELEDIVNEDNYIKGKNCSTSFFRKKL